MPDNQDISLKIFVRDVKGNFRGGTVDVEFKHRTLSDYGKQRGLDASREINIAGLRRAPTGDYQITVTPTDVFERKSQFVNIPASGFFEMKVTIDRARTPEHPDPNFIVKGSVSTAAGAPFANSLVRAIHQNISTPVLLGENRTDNQGSYVIKYSSELVAGAISLRVQVFDESGKLLAQSNPITPAKREEVVNLTLPTPEPTAMPYRVEGKVSRPDQTMLVDGVVQAFDVSMDSEQLLGNSITDGAGHFKIAYLGKAFEARGGPDLIVRVLDSQGRVLATSVVIRKAKPVEQVVLVTNDKLPVDDKRFIVRGTVREVNGKPAIGVTLRAFDRDMRSEEPLGQPTITDKEGRYEITYTAREFSRAEKGSADLRVAVFDPANRELATSKIIYNAQPEEVIDLDLSETRGPSEYERLIAELTPTLRDVPLHELNENDIDFLSGDTGQDRQHIAWLARAANLARQSNSQTGSDALLRGINIPVEAFYGWFRLNLPTDWEPLRLLPISTLRNTLLAAIEQNLIPARLREEVEGMLARVPNPQKQDLTNLLTMTNLPPDRMRAVLTTADGIETITEPDLARLVEQNIVTADEAQSIGLSVSLHRLGGGETSLVSTMLSSVFPSVPTGRLRGARDLALLEPADWESALGRTDSPVPPGISRAQYARSLAMDAVAEFPHAAFVHRATQFPDGIPGKLNLIQPLLTKNANALALDFDALDLRDVNEPDQNALRAAHTDLKRFANLHPGLGLHEVLSKHDSVGNTVKSVDKRVGWLRTVFALNPNVDFLNLDYLPDSTALTDVQFGDLSKEARGLVLQDLKAHQRIHTVTNNAIPAREIMQAGFHSASAIALTRLVDFADQTGLANAEAQIYYSTARDVGNQAAVNWHKAYEAARDGVMTPVRAIPSHNEFFKPLAGFQELINSQPWCDCAHCQSVLSPAAYFVDLMYYIEENILKDSFRGKENHPLHLIKRRPDLWDLELTCKNTSEYVPYLDLVNEILEGYVKENVPHLRDLVPPADAEDLYKYLAEQEGSFKQPFTLPIERLELLLEHFGLSRYRVGKAMGSDRKIQARARLTISRKEYDLITRERTTTDDLEFFKRLFKIDAPASVASPDTVFDPMEMQTLLHATGLAHEIVEAVLKSTFVNTDGSSNARIEIVLGKQRPDDVQNNSELVNKITLRRLDRIHRFVRLWRKLPWTVAELDYVLTQLASPDSVSRIDDGSPGTPGTLERILDLLEVNAEWSLPSDELMALSDAFPPKGLREPTSLFDRLFNQAPFLNRDGRWPPPQAIRFVHPAWMKRDNSLGVSDPNNNTLTRLLAGLQVEDQELIKLVAGLAPALGYQPATTTTDESILLSETSIGILYRHARLMRLLKSTASDFIKLMKLAPTIAARRRTEDHYIRDLKDLASVIEFAAWQRASGFSLDEILYVTKGTKPKDSPDPAKLVNEIIARVTAEKSLEFADTVFTQLGFTDIQSRKIVSDNVGPTKAFEMLADGVSYRLNAGVILDSDPRRMERKLEFADTLFTQIGLTDIQSRNIVRDNVGPAKAFERLAVGVNYRLNADFFLDPATRLIDSSIRLPTTDLDRYNALAVDLLRKYDALAADLLRKYDAMRVLDVALGGVLNLSPEEANDLRHLTRPFTHPWSTADVIEIQLALEGGDRTRLTALLTDTLRYRALFKSDAFLLKNKASSVHGLTFVRRHREFFGLPVDPEHQPITTQVVRNVAAYAALATATDADFSTASGPADIDAIQTVINGMSAASVENLAAALRTDKTRINALKPHLMTLPSNPFEALEVLARCLVLTEQLGVSGESLSRMINESGDTFVALSRAAEDVYGAFRAKYPDEQTFQQKMETFEDKLRPRKRDGLVDFIVSKWPEVFADPNKLYEYFLIDVLLEGCARTSRVVAATSSLQLYVQRALMNLERSNDWDGNIPALIGVCAHFTESDKRNEWYWREHYRVWEANRKVFLYPENYIEPELRDDKTPPFKELEDSLLQQEISDSNVHDAYAKYLIGFDEVARLKIAGAYYDQGTYPDRRDDALHLFGVTQDAPPSYYYRVIHNTLAMAPRISAWQKLTVQIPVSKVSPIVFEGRLYVFWMETTTRAMNNFEGGTSKFAGYRHAVRVKYSTLRADGVWGAPQSLRFSDGVTTEETRIVNDPRTESDPTLAERIDAARQRVADLTRQESNARDEVERMRERMQEAQTESSRPGAPDGAEQEAEAVQFLADAASSFAYWSTPPQVGDDHVARDRAKFAAFEVLAQALPATTAVLRKAGATVTVTMSGPFVHAVMARPFEVRRQIALSDATSNWQQATKELERVSRNLNGVDGAQRRLDALLVRRNVIRVRWDKSGRNHSEPLDNYNPEGWEWDRVYPDIYRSRNSLEGVRVTIVPRNEFTFPIPDDLDLTAGVLGRRLSGPTLVAGISRPVEGLSLSRDSIQLMSATSDVFSTGQLFYNATQELLDSALPGTIVARVLSNSDLQAVNGAAASVIVESKGDVVWMRKMEGAPYLTTRLGTTVTPQLTDRFAHKRASGLLDRRFQQGLQESVPSIVLLAGQSRFSGSENPFQLTNPYLTYFRETFFHIPFLVADHLNSQQKFGETQRWYHYIFDPTAADGILWRYRELNDPTIRQSLREMLTDPQALAAYRADPFNPHAIARTRLSAYQKSIVMKYIDNLLDWGDSLFSQFTMESVNEATMLYVMAQEILGPRPPVLGSCGEGKVQPKNYKTIRPGLNIASDFLIELELPRLSSGNSANKGEATKLVVTKTSATSKQASAMTTGSQSFVGGVIVAGTLAVNPSSVQTQVAGSQPDQASGQYWTNVGGTPLKALYEVGAGVGNGGLTLMGTEAGSLNLSGNKSGNTNFIPANNVAAGQVGVRAGDKIKQAGSIPTMDVGDNSRQGSMPNGLSHDNRVRSFYGTVDLVPPKNAVFCIPPNKDLLAYWARVEDRLFKIRNCMDIAGVRRHLELFAPEIDPRLLVRMKAAGLTLEDVLNSISGNVPPYRFMYLIDKAKQYAGTLQSFGAQLLSALEKRDGEELANLSAVHEHNLLKMRTRMTQLEIDAAEDAIAGLKRQKAAVEYRQDYFRSLSDVGLVASERTQQQHQRTASNFRTQASVVQFIAAILSIIPDVGAPTAMKFGGSQLGAAGRAGADGLNALAAFNEMSASMAGMEASNQRRDQDWKHQQETARRDISQIEKQITAAEIRRDIAVHSLEVHQRTIDQSEEMFEFFRNEKFTNINLYRLLSNRLQGLHRQAFNAALAMAKMTEQAFRAERTDDDTLLDGNYWDAGNAGLLAGERLLIDLQALERQYIEKNYRQLEVEQSFSLAQFAPNDLAELRLTGKCTFTIPEWFFDLTYPGQYRRRLKAARLTIPCVTGPYTNVGATLRLMSSEIRLTVPPLSTTPPPTLPGTTPVPLRHTVVIAASKAQYDAGVFDFNFRDERYMPFEGAGAISNWELSLPQTLRTFDYGTITDVILHLSYTAEFNEGLKAVREEGLQSLITLLRTPSMTRVFSLRQEFPDVFHRLIASPPDTPVDLKIEPRHFPFFLMNRTLLANAATVRFISPLSSVAGSTFAIGERVRPPEELVFRNVEAPPDEIHGPGLRTFEVGDVLQSLTTTTGIAATINGEYVIKLTAAPQLLAPAAPGNSSGAIDPAKLHDIILEVAYSLA